MLLAGKADPLSQSEYLVVAQLGGDTRGGKNESIFLAASISLDTIKKKLQVCLSLLAARRSSSSVSPDPRLSIFRAEGSIVQLLTRRFPDTNRLAHCANPSSASLDGREGRVLGAEQEGRDGEEKANAWMHCNQRDASRVL